MTANRKGLRCPVCDELESSVTDSRSVVEGIRRRRECSNCKTRYTTYEVLGFTAGGNEPLERR